MLFLPVIKKGCYGKFGSFSLKAKLQKQSWEPMPWGRKSHSAPGCTSPCPWQGPVSDVPQRQSTPLLGYPLPVADTESWNLLSTKKWPLMCSKLISLALSCQLSYMVIQHMEHCMQTWTPAPVPAGLCLASLHTSMYTHGEQLLNLFLNAIKEIYFHPETFKV